MDNINLKFNLWWIFKPKSSNLNLVDTQLYTSVKNKFASNVTEIIVLVPTNILQICKFMTRGLVNDSKVNQTQLITIRLSMIEIQFRYTGSLNRYCRLPPDGFDFIIEIYVIDSPIKSWYASSELLFIKRIQWIQWFTGWLNGQTRSKICVLERRWSQKARQ